MAKLLYTDDFDRDVYDVRQDLVDMQLIVLGGENSENRIVKAERRGTETLILTKRGGGHYWVTNWTSYTPEDDINRVRYNDSSAFNRSEIDLTQSLFKQVRLFP